ncbi:MAG: TIGR03790 family protein [Methylococcales bacterium]|nr:TIGR03790 family protein [Methylococcales bacterium]
MPVFCFKKLLLIIIFITFYSSTSTAQINPLYTPLPAIDARQLGIIVNDFDPISIQIANYYQQQRKIPTQNIIRISFNPMFQVLPVADFQHIKKQVDKLTPPHVQAYALTWSVPFRVGCMSITTAFAAGFNEKFCATGCNKTFPSPYFNTKSRQPYTDFKWRPTMALAGKTFKEVKQLIDRGIASDYSYPTGTAYLLETSDKQRSARAVFHPQITEVFNGLWETVSIEQDFIEDKQDVMFYFTGKIHIDKISSNHYLPGAVADHLTSTGGILFGSTQMSSLKWLEAGATGSYGAVIEPCNFVQKFPNPGVMMHYYIKGNSLIEAYWKSVAWPGQGLFIGEPLAKPFAYPQQL